MSKKSNPNSGLAKLLKLNPSLVRVLKPGDLVESVFSQRGSRAAYFDLGAWGTGIVYGVELMNAQDILKSLKIGDKVSAKVIDLENDQGYVELSLAGAEKQKSWQHIKELQDKGEIFSIKIIGANSGGLLAKISEMKAFLPISQLAGDHYPKVEDGSREKIIAELQKLVGQELKVKVSDFNPRNNKLILSEREVLEENVKELLAQYKVGDVVDGIISGVADFGVFFRFADNPKIEGLIHISELDHRLIGNPKEVVNLNDAVKAKIIEIKDGRVALSLKALKIDPWLEAEKFFQAGQEVSGRVSHFNPFGAIVNLDHGLQGMIHVSEFGSVEEMKKQLEIGKEHSFKVDSVKPAEKRIILKIKK